MDPVHEPGSLNLPTPISEANQAVLEEQRNSRHLAELDERPAQEIFPATEIRPSSAGSQHANVPADDSNHAVTLSLTLNKSRLFGQTHWSHGGHEFKKVGKIMRGDTSTTTDDEQTRQLKSEIQILLRRCKMLAKFLKADRPSRYLEATKNALTTNLKSIPGALAERLAHLYISRFESVFRIVHIPSFWKDFTEHRSSADPTQAIYHQIHLAIAIGSSIHRGEDADDLHTAALQAVHDAQAWLSAPLEKSRVTVQALQVQCMLILARHVLSLGGDLIWISMGNLVRTAIQMGLHRNPKHYKKMSLLDCEIRRRLWATTLELDLQAALDSGTPPSLSLADYDTEAPANIDDHSLQELSPCLEPKADDVPTDTSLQRFLFTTLPARLEIVRDLNSIRAQIAQDRLISLSAEIEAACRRCGTYVKDYADSGAGKFKHNLADLLLRRILLPLCRPFVDLGHSPELSCLARRYSFDTATTLLSPLPNEDFKHLTLRGGGLFKSRMIYISLVLCSEVLLDLAKYESSESLARQQPSIFRHALIESLQEALGQCERRIQCGDSNVRMYMKGSVVLALAKSHESNVSIQQQMGRAARDSLEAAYTMLQSRADAQAGHKQPDGADMHGPECLELDLQGGDSFDFDDMFFKDGLFNLEDVTLTGYASHYALC